MDRGLLLAICLIFMAWILLLVGLVIIAKAFVPIGPGEGISIRLAGVVKVIASFAVVAAFLYAWFRVTKALVLGLKREMASGNQP